MVSDYTSLQGLFNIHPIHHSMESCIAAALRNYTYQHLFHLDFKHQTFLGKQIWNSIKIYCSILDNNLLHVPSHIHLSICLRRHRSQRSQGRPSKWQANLWRFSSEWGCLVPIGTSSKPPFLFRAFLEPLICPHSDFERSLP